MQKHKSCPTVFIKQATIAYIQQQYVTVDQTSVNDIRELLTKNYTMLQDIEEQNLFKETETSFIKRFENLETSIMDMIHNPKSLELAISEAVKRDTRYKQVILKLVEDFDYDHKKFNKEK